MEIRVACARDAQILGGRLREADEKEVIAAGFPSGSAGLTLSFTRSSMCFSVVVEGAVAGMFGVVPDTILGHRANVWFLGGPDMARIKKTFVKLSRQMIFHFLRQYPELWNFVDERYESSIRWLKSCGAEFSETVYFNEMAFRPFVIRRA